MVTLTVNGSPYSAAISAVNDEDWYNFTPSSTSLYTMRTYGNTDMLMYLYSSDQTTLLASDDDSGGNGQSLITYNLNASQIYYLKLRGYGSSTGNYEVAVFLQNPSFTSCYGTTILNACNCNSGSISRFYTGSLGINTVIYTDNSLSNFSADGLYRVNSSTVYVLSSGNGTINNIRS
jgi:hypothetical protein